VLNFYKKKIKKKTEETLARTNSGRDDEDLTGMKMARGRRISCRKQGGDPQLLRLS